MSVDALIFVCVSSFTSSLILVQYNTADHFSVFISFIIKKKKSSEMGAMCHIPYSRELLFNDRTNHLT